MIKDLHWIHFGGDFFILQFSNFGNRNFEGSKKKKFFNKRVCFMFKCIIILNIKIRRYSNVKTRF